MTKEQTEIIANAFNILRESMVKYRTSLGSPTDALKAIQLKIGAEEREHFGVVYLTQQNEIIDIETLFSGTIDAASVYPREVVKSVLAKNAAAVILFHNHPSGMCTPSEADKRLTTKLISALDLIDVRTLDHMIVGGTNYVSFAEEGLI